MAEICTFSTFTHDHQTCFAYSFFGPFLRKGPENVNLLLTALYFRQLFSYFFEKKELAFLDIQEWFSKIRHKLLLKNL
jgi:hypothetical protein